MYYFNDNAEPGLLVETNHRQTLQEMYQCYLDCTDDKQIKTYEQWLAC